MVGSPESRVRVIGGLLGPLDARQLRLVNKALENYATDKELTKEEKRDIDAASNFFRNVLETGRID